MPVGSVVRHRTLDNHPPAIRLAVLAIDSRAMRNFNTSVRLTLLAVVMVVASACAGLTARQEALLPAMKLAWQGVSADVGRGIEESVLAQRITPTAADELRAKSLGLGGSIEKGDPIGIANVPWAPLAESAAFGIDARVSRGELGAGVSASLKERLRNFGEALTVFLERR